MSEKKEHKLIGSLKQQLADKVMDRREFVRYATLLGLSAPAAYMMAGKITGESFVPAARAEEMPKGGVIRIAQRVPKIENPHTFSWVYDSNVVRQVCGYLTRTGSDNVTRPHLATKWEVSEDLKTWTFTIGDAKWHDGEDFTAEHAAWNIRHCLDPKVGSSVIGLMKGYMLKDVDTGTKDDAGNPVMTTELWDANAIEVKDAKTAGAQPRAGPGGGARAFLPLSLPDGRPERQWQLRRRLARHRLVPAHGTRSGPESRPQAHRRPSGLCR